MHQAHWPGICFTSEEKSKNKVMIEKNNYTDYEEVSASSYNPVKTQFLLQGEARGATIKNGLEMLINQAEAAYEIWNQ